MNFFVNSVFPIVIRYEGFFYIMANYHRIGLHAVVNLQQMCYCPVGYNQRNSNWQRGNGYQKVPTVVGV